VDGEGSKWPGTWIVHDSDEARTVVDRARNEKYDFVKIYNLIPRDAYFEIAKRSREIGLPFCGHVPYSVSILEATNAGQKSMEHLYGVLEGCSSKEMDLKKERTRLSKGIVFNNETLEALRKINQQELDTFDLKRANQLFKAFAKSRVYHCPTLTVNRAMAFEDEMKSANDPFLAYMPIGVREFWKRTAKLREKVSSADFKMDKAIYQKEVSLIPLMKQAGVKFLAGTDVLNIYCYPGFSLPNELVLLVKAGLTPLEALQAATVNAAEYMGNQNFGTIENGKTADLDLLDANPLEDIANVKRISAVIFKGKLLEKQDLDRMLSGMKKMSESPEPRD